jgi:hypothetical protein
MMGSTYATRRVALVRRPGARDLAARRRILVVAALLAVALGGAAAGLLGQPRGEAAAGPHTGPFSYVPAE